MSIYTADPAKAIARFRGRAAGIPQLAYVAHLVGDDILDMLKAAEKTFSDRVDVLLEPHYIFPDDTPKARIDAYLLADGPQVFDGGTGDLYIGDEIVLPAVNPEQIPYRIEPGYDYNPRNFEGDNYGWLKLKRSPLIEVLEYRMTYSNVMADLFVIPKDWVRIDQKYALVQLVPTIGAVPFSAFNGIVLAQFAGQRIIPQMIKVTYRAGIVDIFNQYPDLVQFLMRLALANAIRDSFPGQSGSISADGLSESTSFDVSKYMSGSSGGGVDGSNIEGEFEVWRRRFHGMRLALA